VISTWRKFIYKKADWRKVGVETRLVKFIFDVTKPWKGYLSA